MFSGAALCRLCLKRLVGTKQFIRCKTYYAVLGVPETATHKEIRAAYIRLSKQLHPDQNKPGASHDKIVRVNEAYEVLGKPESRRSYDEKLTQEYRMPKMNPYQTPYRRPRYGSDGRVYSSRFDPANTYSRNRNPRSDPFSDLNYDPYFYERKSEPRPKRKPMTKEERQAMRDRIRLQMKAVIYAFTVMATVGILIQIYLSRHDYLVLKKEREASANTATAQPEGIEEEDFDWRDDKVIVYFERIFWVMVAGVILSIIKDYLYSLKLDSELKKVDGQTSFSVQSLQRNENEAEQRRNRELKENRTESGDS